MAERTGFPISPTASETNSPKLSRISLRDIYKRSRTREKIYLISKSLGFKSPVSKKPISHKYHISHASADVGLIINSLTLGGKWQELRDMKTQVSREVFHTIHQRPIHVPPRRSPANTETSDFFIAGKQQMLCSLPPGKLRMLREQRLLGTSIHPMNIMKLGGNTIRKSSKPRGRALALKSPVTSPAKVMKPRPHTSDLNAKRNRSAFDDSHEGISGWD